VIVALTLDENGIPEKAEERVDIARRILERAKEYGINKKDIIFDPLALTISSSESAAKETLKAVKIIKEELGCHTSLGVSNVSFGLPEREIINSSFFTMALFNGLSAAIMNPYSFEMLKSYYSYLALSGMDSNCVNYIDFASSFVKEEYKENKREEKEKNNYSPLMNSIIKGLKELSGEHTKELLTKKDALKIVNEEIIPALDIVGVGYENKTLYLPQLLMSAEAAKSAFEVIKEASSKTSKGDKCTFVIATVKGDIHDIGKNIVKLLLENYGFNTIDLGKDVPPEEILDAVTKNNSPLCGLSALMTTTVPAMEETIKLLREKAPWCKVVVGGAVLNEEYAKKIDADKYAKDAMETVRYALNIR